MILGLSDTEKKFKTAMDTAELKSAEEYSEKKIQK